MASRTLEFVFNHVFLPPQLPHRDDHQDGAGDRALVEKLIESCQNFRGLVHSDHYTQSSIILRTLRTFAILHRSNKSLSKNALKDAFYDVKDGVIVILHVAMQNTGLIVRKVSGEYIFESFEASPPAAEVLAADKSLQWDFPSRAVAIPSAIFEEESFQACLTEFLEKASVEPVKQFAAVTLKAGSYAFESRDTVTPAVVGQLLMAILEANGRRHPATLTRKRVRDDVCWSDGAENPWRRSPNWLVLRVGIQRSLCFLLGDNLGSLHYKFFMGLVLSSIANEICGESPFPPDRLAFARTKLARRLAKLQQQKEIATPKVASSIDFLFSKFEKSFTSTLRALNDRLSQSWNLIRSHSTKRIEPLPKRAYAESTALSLCRSRAILNRVCHESLLDRRPTDIRLEERHRQSFQYFTWVTMKPRDNFFASDYFFLGETERTLQSDVKKSFGHSQNSLEGYCDQFQQMMQRYQHLASSAYKSDPEQLSIMLITLLEMWQAIDSMACMLYPLLADYEPDFPRDLLYPLQVAQLSDLKRVQEVERYLESRRSGAETSHPSVFRDVTSRSFAVRYFDQSQDMQQLVAIINAADERAKAQKVEEWTEKSKEYEAIMKQAAETTCLFIEDAFDPLIRRHDDRRCLKHKLVRKGNRMRIQIHEAILPSEDIYIKAVVFELLLPKGFAVWRDATWQLVQLGRRNLTPDEKPSVSLREYSGLMAYMRSTDSSITLASRTKSFLNTHYAWVSFPMPLDKVCLPHGLKYGLFDDSRILWTSNHLGKPDFADLCAPFVPPKSVYGSLRRYLHPTFDGKPISGNEVLANQTRCPNSLTITEFNAFQDLRLGSRTQLMRLLRELTSSNLNFGTLEVGTLVAELALVVGPPEAESVLRASHWVFQDLSFCVALNAQIKRRLEHIAANWREGQTVECLLVLLQRIWSLATMFEARKEARTIMLYVRKVTHNWARVLRREICNATNAETAQKRSQDALLVALLCRKTYILEAATPDEQFQADALTTYLECSFILRDNLPSTDAGSIGKLPAFYRKLYISDLKLVHRLESQLRRAIEISNSAVNEAVNSLWADAKGQSPRQFSSWVFLPGPHDGWVTAQSTRVDGLLEQSVSFDILEGTLLIDGQALGRLPDEYTKQGFFHQFFGDRVFLTYPSSIPGMSYQLASLYEGHQVHFGFRDGVPFMRVRVQNRMLELIQPDVFWSGILGDVPDLPLPLIENCVHWLDLASHSIEIRSAATMWRSKLSNWVIDLRTSQAHRRASLLVDPQSQVFHRIAIIIEPFESRKKMIVFQPERRNLSLQLPGLELSFSVNSEGLLESQSLRAVIDRDQDAGTLYGLESKLVLRDSIVPEDRSVIVAMGRGTIEQKGAHVQVRISHEGYYARFLINRVLGRLECASEPRLIYFKAYCHAVTAFVLPDPLTGRTGTDEAIYCLQSGNAQPWAPVDGVSYDLLTAIAELTPQRVYYPEKLKVLQKVTWKSYMLSTAQHDEFQPLIKDIIQQCRDLHRFHLGSAKPPDDNWGSDEHLLERAQTRRDAFRAFEHKETAPMISDRSYVARDCTRSSGSKNAYESASLIKDWSSRIRVPRDLSALLQEWPLIQGFTSNFELYLLADLINVNLAANWGSLITLCQNASEALDKFKLMFLFGTMSFDARNDMTLVRTLIAVAVMEEFQNLQLPCHASFTHFRKGQVPNMDFLSQSMKPYRTPYPEDERALLPVAMHNKQRRKLEKAQLKHEQQSEDSCKIFARHLSSQWPVREPSISGLRLEDVPLLDTEEAFQVIKPEWEHLFANHELSEHLICVQNILETCQATEPFPALPTCEGEQSFFLRPAMTNTRPTLHSLLRKLLKLPREEERAALGDLSNGIQPNLNGHSIVPPRTIVSASQESTKIRSLPTPNTAAKRPSEDNALMNELGSMIHPFANSEDPVRQAYGKDLQSSMIALAKSKSETSHRSILSVPAIDMAEIVVSKASSQITLNSRLDSIRKALTQGEGWLEAGALMPYITPVSLLEMLRHSTIDKKMSTARDVISNYGEQITHLQHTLRIHGAALRNDTIQLLNETQVVSQRSWQARDHPDWLLLEIDFNVRIRPDQHEVAVAMTTSGNIRSFCLQMNMGQGKSSIIIPMVVAQLADKKSLVRIVVPRPLLLQTAQLLQARLGGLIGRKIKHVPFSRRSSTAIHDLEAYQKLHLDMLHGGGAILTLPEHLLSFQLSGLQELSQGHIEKAGFMMKLQEWFMRNCRDILDECDHMLAVKTQLIYPSGAQTMVDGHPGRWKLVQELLRLVKVHVGPLPRQFPSSIEVQERSRGTFPTIYLLTPQVRDALMQRLTDSVVKGDGGILPIEGYSLDELASVSIFLREAQFPKTTALKIAGVFRGNSDARQRLLLLRGLLIHKILLLGLNKRWNVQYGIDVRRDPIAVPYKAKGIASDQAEFGHPDVSVILTCLSFYYSGLTLPQFQQALTQLIKSDDEPRHSRTGG